MQNFREKKLKSDVFCSFCKVNFIKWRFITAKVERSRVLLCRLAKWIANLAKYALDERCLNLSWHLIAFGVSGDNHRVGFGEQDRLHIRLNIITYIYHIGALLVCEIIDAIGTANANNLVG